jgi:hypothetical protein
MSGVAACFGDCCDNGLVYAEACTQSVKILLAKFEEEVKFM